MFFCGLLLGIKIRPKLIQKEPFGGYIGRAGSARPSCEVRASNSEEKYFLSTKEGQSLGSSSVLGQTRPCSISGFNCTRDHATRFELSCDPRAASNWGVLHVCHRRGCQPVASACVCAAACCRGPSQAGVGFEPPLAIPRTGKVAVAKPSHFSLAAPCCPAHLVS